MQRKLRLPFAHSAMPQEIRFWLQCEEETDSILLRIGLPSIPWQSIGKRALEPLLKKKKKKKLDDLSSKITQMLICLCDGSSCVGIPDKISLHHAFSKIPKLRTFYAQYF